MKLEDIHQFFEYPPPTYLCSELVVCYILSILLQGESYGTELIQRLEAEYPSYRLSDTVLYSAIKFLEDQKAITGYWKKLEGRGRPRRMYQLAPDWQKRAYDLTCLWQEYIKQRASDDFETRKNLLYKYYSQQKSKRKRYISLSTIEDINRFFKNNPPTYLCIELAVCYILSVLLLRESYGTELIKHLESYYPDWQLTDTVLYGAINFLEEKKTIIGYWKKIGSKQRRMYQLCPEWIPLAQDIAHLWHEYSETEVRVEIFNTLGGNYYESGEFYKAVDCYQKSLNIAREINYRIGEIESLLYLGHAYRERVKGDRKENLENAINTYNSALEVCRRENFPETWANIQNSLGKAYSQRIKGDKVENIELAIAAYNAALEVYTSTAFPEQWAKTQNNLGIAFSNRIIGEKAENLEQAIAFYQAALDVYNRKEFPFKWADICKNIADAYIQKIQDNNLYAAEILAYIEYAILFYKDALDIYNRDEFPNEFAIIREKQIGAHHLFEEYQSNFDYYHANFQNRSESNLPESIAQSEIEIRLEREIITDVVTYEVLVKPPENMNNINVGEELGILIYLKRIQTTGEGYFLQIPQNEAIANELNIILKAPGFLLNGDNTASIPLDPNTAQETQTATFRLTALRPGNATITAELYRDDTFETKLETQIQVADIDEATFTPQSITTQSRPVSQADFILRVQAIANKTNSTYKFQYQLRSFRLPSVFSGNNIYTSNPVSTIWLEQVRELLVTTLENISGSLPAEGKQRLVSLGQYLFNHLLPAELRSDIHSFIPHSIFTLLILTDQDVSIPWELLHEGQRFFGERFIIGRWLQELSDTRPYEFPVGTVNVAHYANVEQPELWASLLKIPGAPPPQLLPEGLLHDSTGDMRGLHLIRYSQPADAATRRDAPVRLDNSNDAEEIETKIRPSKLNLRRNRPFVTLGYVKTDITELAELEKTWASAFIRAGCSGFAGSLWAVEPAIEAAFISSFYNQLWTGASLGEAFYTSRQLARAVAPDSLDWLAYVLFGDPMARPYLPVEGKGYAVVEPIGRDIDEPMPVNVPLRFRLSLRRTPPVWHEDRVMEVAEDLRFENLQVHVNAAGLEVTPDSTINMNLAPTGNYLGWFTLTAPPEMAGDSVLVEVYFMDGEEPIDNLIFSLEIANEGGEIGG